ncbi:MAG: hypothetical protein WCV82_04585, partial [Candidatus Paceibacterota bacterium]
GVLGVIELDPEKILADLRAEYLRAGTAITDTELRAKATIQSAENSMAAHIKLDGLERRYLAEAVYLSERYTEIREDDKAYAESLKASSRSAYETAKTLLANKEEGGLFVGKFHPQVLRAPSKLLTPLPPGLLGIDPRQGVGGENDLGRMRPWGISLFEAGRLQKAWATYWWAKGLAKIARAYEQPHGIDLADAHPYQQEEIQNKKTGIWQDVRRLRMEYYLSGGAVEVEDIGTEQEIVNSLYEKFLKDWPDEQSPSPDSSKSKYLKRTEELGENIPPEAVETAHELDAISIEYRSIVTELDQFVSEAQSTKRTDDGKIYLSEITGFLDLQEEVFDLKHKMLLLQAKMSSFLEL